MADTADDTITRPPEQNPQPLQPPPAPVEPAPASTTSTQAYLRSIGPPQSDEDLYRRWSETNEARGQTETDAAKRMEGRLGYADAMIQSPVKPPAVPQLRDMPHRPQLQYRDAFQVFQSPAILLATLGSLMTRRPAVNALTAGAAALNGFMEGDEKRVALEEKNWKNAVEETVKQNEKEMTQFKAEFGNAQLSVQDRNARLTAIFAANRDELGLAALKSGSQERLQQLYDARIKGNEALRNSLVKAQQADERRAQGLLSPEDYQLRAGQALQGDYKGAFQNLGFGLQRAENMRGILEAIRAQRPDMSPEQIGQILAKANQAYTATSGAMRTVVSRAKNLEAIQNELLEQMPAVMAASDAVPRSKFVPLNKLIQQGKVATSDPVLANFATRNLQLAELWARSYNPQGVMRESDRELALAHLSTATSKEAYKAVAKAIEDGVKRNIAGVQKTLDSFSRVGGPDATIPESADAPRPRGKTKDGRDVDWDGSKWVDPITGEAVK